MERCYAKLPSENNTTWLCMLEKGHNGRHLDDSAFHPGGHEMTWRITWEDATPVHVHLPEPTAFDKALHEACYSEGCIPAILGFESTLFTAGWQARGKADIAAVSAVPSRNNCAMGIHIFPAIRALDEPEQ